MRIDKNNWIHFTCCMLIALVVSIVLGMLSNWYVGALAGLSTAIGTGVGKEFGDMKATNWNWYDILSDIVGAFVGAIIGIIIILI